MITHIRTYSTNDFELLTLGPVPDTTFLQSKLPAVDFDQWNRAKPHKSNACDNHDNTQSNHLPEFFNIL
jgi:hypothetical protein